MEPQKTNPTPGYPGYDLIRSGKVVALLTSACLLTSCEKKTVAPIVTGGSILVVPPGGSPSMTYNEDLEEGSAEKQEDADQPFDAKEIEVPPISDVEIVVGLIIPDSVSPLEEPPSKPESDSPAP